MNGGEKYFQDLVPILKDLERFALHLTRDRENAKELLSESILRGYAGYKNLKNNKAFLSYMFTIVYRTNRDEFVRKKRFVPYDLVDWENIYSPELSGEALEDVKLLYSALDLLDDFDREIIVMAELMDTPHKEIANTLGISIANVKVKVFRAKKKLKAAIESGEALKKYAANIAE